MSLRRRGRGVLAGTVALMITAGPCLASAPAQSAREQPQSAEHQRQTVLERSEWLLGEGDATGAAALLRPFVQQQPDDADAQLLLGRALALVPEPAEALRALRRAVELRPDSADAHYTLGTVLARFGDSAGARTAFERVLTLDPGASDAHVSLALLLAHQHDHGAARGHLAAAIEILGQSPEAAYPHYLTAQILREQAALDEALRHLDRAIHLRPDYAEAFLSQGLIKRERQDEAGALEAFRAAARLSPDDPVSRAALGAAYLRAGEIPDAVTNLEHAVRLSPDDRQTRYQLCRALQAAGRVEEANRCAKEVSEQLRAESAAADLSAGQANNRGVELEAVGDLAAALDQYRHAVEVDPFNTVFRRNLALALCRLGRWEEGLAELDAVLAANPDDEAATRARHVAIEQVRKRKDR